MKASDIASVLNFSAFRPEPDDPTASWKSRFPNKRTVFFGLGKQTLTVRMIAKNGRPADGEVIPDVKDLKESLAAASSLIRERTDGGWCAVSLHTRYVISLETNLSRRPGSEDIVKSNPRTVLGGRYERGKRYALTHNPETNSSILLTFDEEQLAKIQATFAECGFNVGRVCCGTYTLLTHALDVINTTKSGEAPASAFFFILCEGAVCALVQQDDKWLELRSRTDVYGPADVSPALELVAPFQSRIPPTMPVVIVADTTIPGLAEVVAQTFEGHEVRDISEPDLLSRLMIQS